MWLIIKSNNINVKYRLIFNTLGIKVEARGSGARGIYPVNGIAKPLRNPPAVWIKLLTDLIADRPHYNGGMIAVATDNSLKIGYSVLFKMI